MPELNVRGQQRVNNREDDRAMNRVEAFARMHGEEKRNALVHTM